MRRTHVKNELSVVSSFLNLTLSLVFISLAFVSFSNTAQAQVIPADAFDQGFVSLSFDDGTASIYANAIPILDAKGYKSTQFIISAAMNCSDGVFCLDFMKTSDVQALKASGHEISAHTRSDPCIAPPGALCPGLVVLSPADMQYEVDGVRTDILNKIGKPANTFAYPFGEYSDTLIAKLKAAGFKGARTVAPGLNTKSTDRFKLFARQVNADTSTTSVKVWIDEAVATKSWLVLVFHEITPNCVNPIGVLGDIYCASPDSLQDIVNYLSSQNVQVKTVSEGLALMNNEPVSDGVAPVITEADLSVEATSTNPYPVTFSPGVADNDTNLSGSLGSFCTTDPNSPHPIFGGSFAKVVVSGFYFPIGTTTVTCTASDIGGNIGSKIFSIGVKAGSATTTTATTTPPTATSTPPTTDTGTPEVVVAPVGAGGGNGSSFSGGGRRYSNFFTFDLFGFNMMMIDWGKTGLNIPSDLNYDGKVDILDFNILMVNWQR